MAKVSGGLNIYNLAQPIPNITLALQPVSSPSCSSFWNDLNESIRTHPFVAAGLLGAGFLILWRKG